MAKSAKTISLLVDHVFMPIDLGAPKWETSEGTQRYPAKDEDGKRVKYDVHPDLADFLIGRDQAVEVPKSSDDSGEG